MTTKPRHKPGSALGTYSKGNEYSVTVNFGTSGGETCSTSCVHNPNSEVEGALKDCYAVRAENRPDRAELKKKLKRHEKMGPALVCGMALVELQMHIQSGKRIDWMRISTNGAVPEWDSPQCTSLFKSQFRTLLLYAAQNGIKVHMPVETWDKAEGYRSLVGDIIAVRESIHCPEKFVAATGAVSTSTGSGLPLLERVEKARGLARERREKTGRNVIVCPAVTSSFKLKLCRSQDEREKLRERAKRSKCGNCTACANPLVDIIYPAH